MGALDQAVGEKYRIFGKVRVADVIEPRRGLDASNRQKAFNRISAKHFDFVLCAKNDLSVVCAIELDDQSHQQRKRQERDAFLADICQASSLPFLQVVAQRNYSISELREKIFAALERAPERASEPEFGGPSAVVLEPGPSPVESHAEEVQPLQTGDEPQVPACPKCGAPMVRRKAKSGNNAGLEFWGCSAFPKCRTIVQEEYKVMEPTA